MKMATPKQIEHCRVLFKKVKLYYRCQTTPNKLRDEVLKRTGFDLDELEQYEAEEIITILPPIIQAQRDHKYFNKDGWWNK